MARRRQTDEGKKRSSRARREQRKRERAEREQEGVVDKSWILRDLTLAIAQKIVSRAKERPYWLSIRHGKGDGNPPVSGYYPCTMFRTANRVYYGFLLREHRERFYYEIDDARRELTDTVRAIAPQMVS